MTAALIIFIAAVIIFIGGIAGTWAVLRWDDRRGDPGDGDREATAFRKIAHEIAHEEYLPAPLAACPATRPPKDSGVWADRNAGRFDSALGSPAHDHALSGAAGLPTLADPQDTLAPALQDATPEGGPSAGARAPEPPAGEVGTGGKRAADPVTPATEGGEAPRPGGAPEGNEPAARPPQGTTGPGDLLAKARAAVGDYVGHVQAIPLDDYVGHVQDTTAYADPRPWNPLSAETEARGFAAIKAEVAP